MAFSAFTEINSWMEVVFEPLATDLPGKLATGIIPLVAAGVSLQVAFHGFAVIRGSGGSNHFLDVFAKAMRAFLVFALCLAGSTYVSDIRPVFEELQSSLVTYVSGGGGNIYTELDAVMQSGISTFESVHKMLYEREHLSVEICIFGGCKGIHLDGVPAIILQAIVSFFILAFGIFAFIDVQVISQSIVIVLAFGPLFLAGFAFQSTSKWAEGWLTSAVKYVMTAIVLLVVVIAAKQQAEKFIVLLETNADGLIPFKGTVGSLLYQEQGKVIAIMIVLSALLAKASSLAGDMVGSLGIASNAIGMVRAAQGSAIGAAKGLVQGGLSGGGVKGAMKGLAYGAAGMNVTDGMGRGSRPVSGARGNSAAGASGGGQSPAGVNRANGPAGPKSFARRAQQRMANTAAYALGTAAGRTVGQTRLPAMAQQARDQARQARARLSAAMRPADPAHNASVHSSRRAGPAFRDAWQRAKAK